MLDRWRVEGFKSDESFYKYPACLLNISSTHGKPRGITQAAQRNIRVIGI